MKSLFIVALVASAVWIAQSMSIDTDPVRVTHRNSGPRYDIGEIDRLLSSMTNDNNSNNANDNKKSEDSGSSSSSEDKPFGGLIERRPAMPVTGSADSDEAPIGRITIKRIVLVPMSMPSHWATASDKHDGDKDNNNDDDAEQTAPSAPRGSQAEPFDTHGPANPLWPFMASVGPVRPSRPSHPSLLHHLFGADEASRSPQSEREPANVRPIFSSSGTERENDNDNEASQPAGRPIAPFDPIQMMVDMMRQTIEEQLKHAAQDLNKAESAQNSSSSSSSSDGVLPATPTDDKPATSESSDESFARPPAVFTRLFGVQPGALGQSKNKTQEDTVMIDGKKFVRKLVENRHVGDNFVFMTRRFMLVPQNSTDDQLQSTTTTTAPTTTLAPTTWVLSREPSDKPKTIVVENNKPIEASSATTETPLPSAIGVSEKPASTESGVEETTASTGLIDRLKKTIERTERLMERITKENEAATSTTTTEKPKAQN